jgi:predicted HicB family RNase H-like nuclease
MSDPLTFRHALSAKHLENNAASAGDRLPKMSSNCVNDDKNKPYLSFPLRLAASLKRRAILLASRDGVSLNHFITQAVAEKIGRLREGSSPSPPGYPQKSATALGTRIRCEVKTEFTAYTVVGLQPVTIPAGHVAFAILTTATAETDEIEFTWGSVEDIRYKAPRDLFLRSTRR